jgi:hypothetical protein
MLKASISSNHSSPFQSLKVAIKINFCRLLNIIKKYFDILFPTCKFMRTKTSGGVQMKLRSLVLPVLLISLLSWLFVGCGQGEKPEETADSVAQEVEMPDVERPTEAMLSAVVEAVDYDARTLTLKDEAGNTQTLEVRNPSVPLENLKAGDQVTMTISQKQVSYVAAPDEELPSDETLTAVGESQGEQEGAITVVQAQQMATTVEAIDLENRMVTLVGADGTPLTLPVKEDVKNLENLQVGDNVVTQITQVISVSVAEESSEE